MFNRQKQLNLIGLTISLVMGLLFSSTVWAQVVSTIPDNPTPQVGDTISIQVDIASVTDLYAVSFDLSYDPVVLNYTGTIEGGFMNQDAQNTSMQAALLNGTAGQLVVGISRIGNIAGVSGSGTLVTISFQVIGDYCSSDSIAFGNAYLEGPVQDSVITATWNGTTVDVILASPANPVTSDPSFCDQIDLSWDTVSSATEYDIYRSNAPGGPYGLPIGTAITNSYQDTDNILPTLDYYYQVKAKIGTCESELSVEVSGVAACALGALSDINGNGRVDGRDLSILARAFGSADGDARYNGRADLNRDGLIDGEDLSILAADFGLSY